MSTIGFIVVLPFKFKCSNKICLIFKKVELHFND